jgi:hypothetical protein
MSASWAKCQRPEQLRLAGEQWTVVRDQQQAAALLDSECPQRMAIAVQ